MSSQVIAGPWCGALTDSSVVVKASVFKTATAAKLVVANDPGLTAGRKEFPATSLLKTPGYDYKTASFQATGLNPGKQYFYRIEFTSPSEASMPGRFRTAPAAGSPVGFQFGLASCAKANPGDSRPEAYQSLVNIPNLLFFFHLGDYHYWNIETGDVATRLDGYDSGMRRPSVGDLFRQMPVAYTWDDHDFLGNNSMGGENATNAATARQAYDLYVPHYALPPADQGIYQSFQLGRVLFLQPDSRFHKRATGTGRTIYGATQKAWLKERLLHGKSLDLIVWANSVPWIAPADPEEDDWGGFAAERAELAGFIKDNQVRNLCMISGDAHMLAIDDGSNSGFAPGGKGGFPVFHAAALESPSSAKGGPYSHGSFAGKRQFGTFEIRYDAAGPRVIWQGWRAKKDSGNPPQLEKLAQLEFDPKNTFSGF